MKNIAESGCELEKQTLVLLFVYRLSVKTA